MSLKAILGQLGHNALYGDVSKPRSFWRESKSSLRPTISVGRSAAAIGNDPYLRTPAVPGSVFERPNPLIAGGPDPNALIQIRDRLAAHGRLWSPGTR